MPSTRAARATAGGVEDDGPRHAQRRGAGDEARSIPSPQTGDAQAPAMPGRVACSSAQMGTRIHQYVSQSCSQNALSATATVRPANSGRCHHSEWRCATPR